ncbi:TfoX/Sxy family protein [Variovorax dokdonensis]|uniref:TfoX/Sxy family protein n=1 Tax=Variovorax dokdonensis TaxID=344883 RepID=A0ABT7N662_9BURK|nr:TfoX/Sxy family protein [Variovorax dokdonensis]MDM0043422.1 TfoX/Sxy family protein [Variovorax dokdonensis]
MPTSADFIEYVAEQIALGARLTHRKMFGEYALYVDAKVVAFACDNSLFIKPSPAAESLAPRLPKGPPYPGAKDYPVADELLDDTESLRRLILATADLMPEPKPKSKPRAKAKPAAKSAPKKRPATRRPKPPAA